MLAAIILSLIFISQLAIGMLVFFESRRTKRMELKLFSLVTLSTLVWTIANGALLFVDSQGTASNLVFFNIANRASFVLGSVSLEAIFLFCCYYPVRKPIRALQKLVLGCGLALIIMSATKLISGEFKLVDGHLIYRYGAQASLVGIFAVFIVAYVFINDVILLRRNKDANLQKQAKTVITGLSLTMLHSILFIIVIPSIFGKSNIFYAIGYASPFYLIVFTVYGLLKQGLFDIRLIVARSVAYVLSIGGIGLAFSLLLFGVSTLVTGNKYSQTLQQITFVGMAIIAAVSYQSIKRFFDRITNSIFYKDAYDTQILLNQLNTALVSSYNLEDMLKVSSRILIENLKASFVAFDIRSKEDQKLRIISVGQKFVEDDIKELRTFERQLTKKVISSDDLGDKNAKVVTILNKLNIGILANMVANGSTKGSGGSIGYLMIGSKKSGYPYNKDDIRVIKIIADELVIAVQNSLRFEEIQTFAATLQEKVDDATRKLRLTNEKLRQLDQTKDDFISMASHQLRTPLTSVKGYVSMVLDEDAGKVNAQQRKLLDQAFISSQRMVYLIADLLNVSRLKTGKFVIEPKPTNLAEVVESELEQLKETAKGRDLKLLFERPKSFPSLNLDETKIRQVIMNFSDNAIYYTPAGGTITVGLVDKPESVELTVSDNGIGVPKSEQHHLFTKFYRAGNAKKARPDGTGLGLFMAQKVIVAQGGAIIFHSEENKGSTFGFSFPKAKLLVK